MLPLSIDGSKKNGAPEVSVRFIVMKSLCYSLTVHDMCGSMIVYSHPRPVISTDSAW